MGAIVCTSILVVTFLCGMSHAYYSGMRPPSGFPGYAPRYDSCKETIEDLKALLEIAQSLKPETTMHCPTCTSTLSEELIVKLVNALIYTATQNCGFNGRGCGGIPVNNGGGVGGNTGVVGVGGNNGGVIVGGGGNTVIGGNSAGSGGNHAPGGKTDGTSPKSNDGLVNVGALDDKHTAHVEVAGKKVLGLDVGKQSGSPHTVTGAQPAGGDTSGDSHESKDPGLVNLGLLNEDNSLASLDLGDTKVLGVNVGKDEAVSKPGTPGTAEGPLGGVTNGLPGGDSLMPSGTSHPTKNNADGVTSPVTALPPQGPSSPVNTGAITNTATSQAAAVSPKNTDNVGGLTNTVLSQGSSVPSNHGDSTAPVGEEGSSIHNVNSGNTETKKDSVNVLNVLNQPKTTTNN